MENTKKGDNNRPALQTAVCDYHAIICPQLHYKHTMETLFLCHDTFYLLYHCSCWRLADRIELLKELIGKSKLSVYNLFDIDKGISLNGYKKTIDIDIVNRKKIIYQVNYIYNHSRHAIVTKFALEYLDKYLNEEEFYLRYMEARKSLEVLGDETLLKEIDKLYRFNLGICTLPDIKVYKTIEQLIEKIKGKKDGNN